MSANSAIEHPDYPDYGEYNENQNLKEEKNI